MPQRESHTASSQKAPLVSIPLWIRLCKVLWKITAFLGTVVVVGLVVNVASTWLTSSHGTIPTDSPLRWLLAQWPITVLVGGCFLLIALLTFVLSRWPIHKIASSEEQASGTSQVIEQQRGLMQPPVPLSLLNRQNRMRMLRQVRLIWIDGLLRQLLHHATEFEPHLQERPDMLANPWRLQIQELDHAPRSLPDGTTIVQVYDMAEGELLILGEPGAGKTTLLLELTRILLERTDKDEQLRIPIVFNLSSWAEERRSLSAWLVEELLTKYQVSRKIGQGWIDADQILPLLDGLDEVTQEARAACVQAINTYHHSRLEERGGSPIIICCRSEEYAALSTRVILQHAVSILPLTDEQINSYLEQAGEQVKELRQALNEDAELHSLVRQPLMLNIFTLAYQGALAAEVPIGKTREETQHAIFATYVDHMLKRRNQSTRWKPEQVINWLIFLAKQMQQRGQTVFSVEDLQPTWLSKGRKLLYQCCLGLVRALVFGLLGGLLEGLVGVLVRGLVLDLFAGLIFGLGIGLFAGLVGVLIRRLDTGRRPAEALTWSWQKAFSGLFAGLVMGLVGGFVVGLSAGLVAGLSAGLSTGLLTGLVAVLLAGLVFGPVVGLIVGLIEGLVGGLVGVLVKQLDTGIHPAEALIWSWQKALIGLIFGLVVASAVGLVLALVAGIVGGEVADLLAGPVLVLVLGLVLGLLGGLIFGLIFGLSGTQLPERFSLSPNEGIWRSGKNGLVGGSVLGLIFGFIIGLVTGLIRGLVTGLVAGLLAGMVAGLLAGMVVGLEAFVKHFLLRLFLSQRGDLPRYLVPFLDEAVARLLLRKVGGSYIFVHRLLLDYFAEFGKKET